MTGSISVREWSVSHTSCGSCKLCKYSALQVVAVTNLSRPCKAEVCNNATKLFAHCGLSIGYMS